MRFMVIVKSTPDTEKAGAMPTEAELAEMGRFNEQLIKAGVMLSGEGLHGSAKGRRVRYGAKTSVVDGPFVESKELVAGYWIWKCASLEEAVEWAKRAPFRESEVEIRQVHELEDFPAVPDFVKKQTEALAQRQ
ncbi:MAG: YciI family protein [Myxococcaceae bacterium]|nr:YciI family protein [Myxococcaceae bacterium]